MLLPSWLDPYTIIQSTGPWALWVVTLIVFVECGLFAPLPGDSLLFAVGMLTAMGVKGNPEPVIHYFDHKPATLAFVCLVLFIAAIGGNICGYYLGRLVGPPLFKPRKGLMGKAFDPKHVDKTHEFFEKYGSKALILARFVPFVRTFVTMIAGIGKMDIRKFTAYSAVGAALWVGLITVAGYFLGNVGFVRDHIEMVLVAIVVVSVIPMVVEYLRERSKRKRALSQVELQRTADELIEPVDAVDANPAL